MRDGVTFVSILFVLLLIVNVSAVSEGFCVEVILTDISPSSIGVNEEFTVGVLIDNCGDKTPRNIVFELRDISPYIDVKEPLIQEIGALTYANSKRFLVYHMKTKDASPGDYLLNYKVTYNGETTEYLEEGNFPVTIIGDEAKLNIASVKLDPTLPLKGDTVELTLRIENFGKGDANSIKVKIEHPFEGTKESFMGTLEGDEDGPAIFTFLPNKVGEFEFPVEITYVDDFGEKKIDSSINVVIVKKKINWAGIFITLVIIAAVVLFMIYYFKGKKERGRIMEEVLNGNNGAEKIEKKNSVKNIKSKKTIRKKLN
jgi:hypothetical protein